MINEFDRKVDLPFIDLEFVFGYFVEEFLEDEPCLV
jgi:hypothetical protein